VLSATLWVDPAPAQTFNFDGAVLTESPNGAQSAALAGVQCSLEGEDAPLGGNPAALAGVQRNRASFCGTLLFGNANLSASESSDAVDYSAHRGGSLGLNFIGFAVPLSFNHPGLVGMIAIKNLANLSDHLTLARFDSSNSVRAERDQDRSGGTYALSAGLAYRALPKLLLGANLNLISGQAALEQTHTFQNRLKKLRADTSWTNKISAFRVEFGVIWRASRLLSLGGHVVFPHSLHYSDIEQSSESGNYDRQYDSDVSMSIPAHLTLGAALRLNPRTLVAMDYCPRPWDKIETHIDGDTQDPFFASAHSVRFGVEHRISSGSLEIPLRIGYFNQPEQIFDYQPESRGKQVSSHVFTGGFGLVSSTLCLELAVAYGVRDYDVLIPELSGTALEVRSSKFQVLLGTEFYF